MSLINTPRRNMMRRKFMNSTILCASLILASTSVFAGGERSFSQPEQSAGDALKQFAKQTNVNILFSDDVVRNERSPALTGTYDTPHALGALLMGTGLVFEETDDNTYIIRKKQQRSDAAGSGATQVAQATKMAYQNQADNAAPVAVASDEPARAGKALQVAEASNELEEVLVQAKRRASSATKFELSVIDTPQSIKAVTSDVLDMAGVHGYVDLEKVDASVSSKGAGFGSNFITIRGFDLDLSEGIKINGVPMINNVPIDFFVFERIEIMKGPSSAVYGQNAVGGMLNAVLKKPTSTFGGTAGALIGSWGHHRIEGDIGGPLTADGKLSFRAVAAYEEGGDFTDFSVNKNKLAYGALKYDFDDATSATITLEYQHRDQSPNNGLGLGFGTLVMPANVPASRLYGAPWARTAGETIHAEGELTHKFANNWTFKLDTQYDRSTRNGNESSLFGLFNANGDLVSVGGVQQQVRGTFTDQNRHQWSAEASLTGDFDLFGHSHTFFVGVDHRINKNSYNYRVSNIGFLNLYNPDYSALNPPRLSFSDYANIAGSGYVNDNDREFWGGSVQLLLHPVDRLSVLLGARWDKSKITTLSGPGIISGNGLVRTGTPFLDNVLNTTVVVPSVGVTYEIRPQLNLYANYSESFVPQVGQVFGGGLIKPDQGYQFEGGIKGNFGETTATLAVFDLTRSHVVGVDVQHPGYSLEIGTQRSKGVEFDVFGNILPGWSVYGSFAYVDAKITESDFVADIGARMFNVPKYAASLYSNYQVQKGPLAGLGFGGGVITKQSRVWGLPHIAFLGRQLDVPGYTTVDLRVFYEIGNVMIDLKANNVFDERYYVTSAPGVRQGIFPGRPREFVGSVKYKF